MSHLQKTISFYGSHDASVTYVDDTGTFRVLEYERFVRKRYAMFSDRFDDWDKISMVHGNHITSEGKGGAYLSLSQETQCIMNKRLEKYQKILGYIK